MSTGAKKLRELLKKDGPIVIAGAHNGLSAKLVERAGFEGIWASGFEISASYGIPDANILTQAENLSIARQMVEAAAIPVVADCDNGYGNAVNTIHMVRQYEAAGIAAVCIEDNVFPKRCSFYAGVRRELATPEEHAGKIRAAKDTQRTEDFVVIARTEALIAGWGMEEALKRGRAYADAGADMILIHSKSKDPGEVLGFAKAWDRETPLVCVPTIYKSATVSQLYDAGFKLIIFANHAVRSSIKAMRETLATLREKGHTGAVEDRVVPLDDVYDIIGVSQMNKDEKTYMPAGVDGAAAVVLAAGFEPNLMPLIADKPRAMLDVKGKTILERQIDALNTCNIKDIAVVRGYKKELFQVPNVRFYDNDEYEKTGEVVSLMKATAELERRVIVMYGDVICDPGILEKLLKSPADITLVVDRSTSELPEKERASRVRDYVHVDAPATPVGERFVPQDVPSLVKKIGSALGANEASGEFIGVMMLTQRGCQQLKDAWSRARDRGANAKLHEAPSVAQAKLTDLLHEVIAGGGEVRAIETYKGWMEIDTFDDYQRAWATLR